MTTLILSTRIPSESPIEDFDLVAIDGRLLLVCVDFGGREVFTWDLSDDRWTEYRLDLPYRPADFLTRAGSLPTDNDSPEVLTIGAAVVDGRIVVGGGGPHHSFAQWDLASGAVRTHARLDHGAVARTATMELDGRPFFLSGDSSAFPAFLRVWDASRRDTAGATDVEPVRLDGHGDGIGGITAGTLNGRPVVVSGGWDGCVLVWDVYEQTILGTFDASIPVRGIGLTTVDGRVRVVVAGEDQVMLGAPDPDAGTWDWEESIDVAEELSEDEEEYENPHHVHGRRHRGRPPDRGDRLGGRAWCACGT